MTDYQDRIPCPECDGILERVYTPVAIQCHWGTGCIGGERQGYIPGVDNPQSEIRADMKALEEKMTHTDNAQKRHKLKQSLDNFAEAHEDVLK